MRIQFRHHFLNRLAFQRIHLFTESTYLNFIRSSASCREFLLLEEKNPFLFAAIVIQFKSQQHTDNQNQGKKQW